MAAVDPVRLLGQWCAGAPPLSPHVNVIAAGKAAWGMAAGFLRAEGPRVDHVLVAGSRFSLALDVDRVEWCDAGHPMPNEASVRAGRRALEIAHDSAAAGRQLVLLLSGGASAMLCLPSAPLNVAHKSATARALMRAGIAIDGLNCVRKHLSDLKGGRLGAAAGSSLTLAISDVHGPVPDDPAVIGSGPTVADPSSFAQALDLAGAVPDVPSPVLEHLRRGAAGEIEETVKPGDPRLAGSRFEIVGTRAQALRGAAREAEGLGYDVVVEREATSGEARVASQAFLARARHIGAGAARPLCVLAAGETTVAVCGGGAGGRNQEFALAATPVIGSLGRACALGSAGTDGIDGPTDAAGAIVDSATLDRSIRLGLDWCASLADNDAYRFFEPLGDLITWGPTGTNVGDVHVLLIA